jgi:hypothetical protein
MVIRDRRSVRRVLGAALGEWADPAFTRRGFRRSGGSLTYRRAVDEGHQRWVLDFELRQRTDQGGAYLFPAVEVVFAPVIDIARRMLPPSSASVVHYSLRLPVELFAPALRPPLIVGDELVAADVAFWLATLLEGRLGAVLDSMTTVGGFAETMTSGTLVEQPMTPVNWISVAAAHLHLGDPRRALGILERYIDPSNPGLAEHFRAFLGPRLAAGHSAG